jgi:hypothetical protein
MENKTADAFGRAFWRGVRRPKEGSPGGVLGAAKILKKCIFTNEKERPLESGTLFQTRKSLLA